MEPQTTDSVTLGWGSSSTAASYEYCYDTSNDNGCGGSWTMQGKHQRSGQRTAYERRTLAGARKECRWDNGCQQGW
jgi:hypothetical protein